jgi:hypothetical protein
MVELDAVVLSLFDFHEKCRLSYGLPCNFLNSSAQGKFSTHEPFSRGLTVVEAKNLLCVSFSWPSFLRLGVCG